MGPKPILTREEERTVAAIMSAGSRRPPASIGELRLRLMGDPTVSVSEAAYRIKVETLVRDIMSAGRRPPQADVKVPPPLTESTPAASASKPPRNPPPLAAAPARQAAPVTSKGTPPEARSPVPGFREMPGRVLVVDEDIPDVLALHGLTMAQLEDLNLGPVLRAQADYAAKPHWIWIRPRSEVQAELATAHAG